MKKIFLFGFFLAFPFITFAHPGGTDSSGCHTCRTNCGNWGLSYGEYHCHNNRGTSQPMDPIHSHYGSPGYTTPAPEYEYNFNKTDCPSNATYSYLEETCMCDDGYKTSSDKTYCVLDYEPDICYGIPNVHERDGACYCDEGFYQDENICKRIPNCPENSEFFTEEKRCVCDFGYKMTAMGRSCIEKVESMGGGDYNFHTNTIDCYVGFEFVNGDCVRKMNIVDSNKKKRVIQEKEASEIYYDSKKTEIDSISEDADISMPEPQSIETPKEVICEEGFTIGLNKKHCIKIPKNAHAVDSLKDSWLCNEGYKEVKDKCLKVEKETKETATDPLIISEEVEAISEKSENSNPIEKETVVIKKEKIKRKGLFGWFSSWFK